MSVGDSGASVSMDEVNTGPDLHQVRTLLLPKAHWFVLSGTDLGT